MSNATVDFMKILVATGSRAEYGHLYWLLHELKQDSDIQLYLAITGTHLSKNFGETQQEITKDGFHIDFSIDARLEGDRPSNIAAAMANITQGFSKLFENNPPNLLVLLGDRYETFAIAQAGLLCGIPIAHLHGGERTEGMMDEAMRHSITKMSHLHFAATEEYRNRVIELGEHPTRVFNVGAPGLDHLKKTKLLTLTELQKDLNFELNYPFFLVTFHSTTLNPSQARTEIQNLLLALDEFENFKIIFTKQNADVGGAAISDEIERYVANNPKRCLFHSSLGFRRYLSAMKLCEAVLGNSSSGIIEAPALRKPTVNIGDRQKGRLMSDSIISCTNASEQIVHAIKKTQSDEFKNKIENMTPVYGEGDSSKKIFEVIKTHANRSVLDKTFFDVLGDSVNKSLF